MMPLSGILPKGTSVCPFCHRTRLSSLCSDLTRPALQKLNGDISNNWGGAAWDPARAQRLACPPTLTLPLEGGGMGGGGLLGDRTPTVICFLPSPLAQTHW